MMLQLVWICKQHDVFQFEYWLYFNVFSRIKNTHSHSNTIVLCKIGNYRGINLYVTFITVSLTKKHTHRMLKTQMVLQKAQSIKIVCICVGYRSVSVEISCIIIENTIVHPLFRSRDTIVERLELFLEFVHKKRNFSLHLIAIVKDARIDDFLLTARQMTSFNRPAWFECFSFWCEKNSKCYHKSHSISIKNEIQKWQLCIVSFESKLPYFFMISGFCNEFLDWIYSIRFAWMI